MNRLLPVGGLMASFAAALAILSPIVTGSGSAPAASADRDLQLGEHEREETRSGSERARPAGEVKIAWVGDITPGSRYGAPPKGGTALFGPTRGTLQGADLTLGNLEGTLTAGGTSRCPEEGGHCFSFRAPPENAAALRWAGFDLLNLANNHAFDFGAEGQAQTLAALGRQRLRHTGRPGEIAVVRSRGIRVAVVGFAPYPWAADLRDLASVRNLLREARRRAELVVVVAHLGAEGAGMTHVPTGTEMAMGENRGDTRAFAHAAVEAGADLVLGSGPHVLRGIELYRGKVIAYSLGNFAGWRNFSTAGDLGLTGILKVRLSREGSLRGGRFTSLRMNADGVPAPDETNAASVLVGRLSSEDFGRAGLRLLRDGSF